MASLATTSLGHFTYKGGGIGKVVAWKEEDTGYGIFTVLCAVHSYEQAPSL